MTRLRLMLTRVDVRLALYLAGLTAAFTSALLCGLLAYALKEGLEEQVARADDVVTALDGQPPGTTHVVALHPRVPYRVRGVDGRELASGGSWPAPSAMRRKIDTWTALFARADEYVGRARTRADGSVIEAAAPLEHFVRERRELTNRTIIVVLFGFLGSIVLGVVSARRALRPLRDTTAAIRAIDPRRLADRLSVRGTGDDVDALTLATNEVLARLEAAFARLAAFSADAAHELRTPVNHILNTAEVALTTTPTGTSLFVNVSPGVYAPRPIKVGGRGDGKVVVTEGVKAGDAIVVRGTAGLRGETIRSELRHQE